MARKEQPIKNRWIGARIDESMANQLDDYCEAAEMNLGALIRKAVKEFVGNHPLKEPNLPFNPTGALNNGK